MAKDYFFCRTIDRGIDEARYCDGKIEGHCINIALQLNPISHPLGIERDKDRTIRQARYYVPGILSQSSVRFEFHNREQRQVDARAFIHITGLIQEPNKRLTKILKELGYENPY